MTKQIRAYNPREVSQKKYEIIKWKGRWRESFGCPAMNETWFISGASAQGKSSFVMQLAKKVLRIWKDFICECRRRYKAVVSTKT